MQGRRRHAVPRAGLVPALLLLLVLVLGASGVQAQQIVLGTTRNLDFGRFVAGSGGTITISPTGVRSRTGGVILLNSPTASQAGFNVGRNGNGGYNKGVIISMPSNGQIRLSNGSNSMAVSGFTSSPSNMATLPPNGMALSIGATLTVAPNQAPGTYSGSFPLTVNFQ
ncbi:DUF4402 domain-containing protein [Massilia sp. ST3]|uniref:DUF4402 domain-containing protein n=1 Tax=Massilia sp. ST3 TaxID=2824903 RepID=UPI001B84313F|nr:DUF4402 domain-containing protein [Massilia sp. ST3]